MMERATSREVWRETQPLLREVRGLYIGAAVAVILSTLITLAGPAAPSSVSRSSDSPTGRCATRLASRR